MKCCKFCTYTWQARLEQPKSCPRCKRRFDYETAREILNRVGREFGYNLVSSLNFDEVKHGRS